MMTLAGDAKQVDQTSALLVSEDFHFREILVSSAQLRTQSGLDQGMLRDVRLVALLLLLATHVRLIPMTTVVLSA